MAVTIEAVAGLTGGTYTLSLFPYGSDTVDAGADAVSLTNATNRKTMYTASVTLSGGVGEYYAEVRSAGVVVMNGFVYVSAASGTFTIVNDRYPIYFPAQTISPAGRVTANADQFSGQTITAAAGVTMPADVASTTNITAGTITTATNVTTVNGLAAGVITAASIAADAITDAKVAADVTIASVTGAVGSVTGNVGGNVTGSVGSVASGGIASTSFAAGAITAAAIAADAIGASELAADAITEIQSGLATAANLATVAGYLDTEIAAILADTNELQTDWANGGRLDLIVDAILEDTGTAGVVVNSYTTSGKAEMQAEAADALLAYDPPTRAEATSDANSILLVLGTPTDTDLATDIANAQASATSLLNLSRVDRSVPEAVSPPASSTETYRIELTISDGAGNMEDPDSAPTISLVDESGNSRTSRLDSTTMSSISTGRYRAIYTATSTDPVEQLNWIFSVIEGGATRLFVNSMRVVASAASDIPTVAEIRAEMDSNSTKLAAIVADTNELQTDWTDGGRLDVILDARASQASVDTVDGVVDAILVDTGTDGVVVNSYTTAGKAEVQAEVSDALTVYDGPTEAEMNARTIAAANYATAANLSTVAGYIDTEVASILTAVGTTIPNLIGSPASTLAADIAAVKAQTAAIETDTQDLQAQIGAAGSGLTAIPWNAAWDAEVQSEVADALTVYDPPTRTEATSDKAEILTRLGTPADTDLATDIANVDVQIVAPDNASIAAIKAKTDNLPASPAAVGDAMTLTSGERNAVASALLVLTDGIESGWTLQQVMQQLLGMAAGILSGAATNTVIVQNPAGTKNRVTATVDASGNRTPTAWDKT